MDIPDWGTSLLHCLALGEQAKVVLDTGHHAPNTNIEFIVAQLLRVGRLGAFDFNSRFYGDDDLIVGSTDPFQLFRIMNEIVEADALRPESAVNFMLDQCHNIEPKIPGQIRSVMNVQEATAKALLVDREALHAAQRSGDVLAPHGALTDAFSTDVRPLLVQLRESKGLDPDPYAAYARSGYQERVARERVGGQQAGWGAWRTTAISPPGEGPRPPRPSQARGGTRGRDPGAAARTSASRKESQRDRSRGR